MADMVVAAGVDAARDLDLELADVVLAVELAKRSEIVCATGIVRAVASAQ